MKKMPKIEMDETIIRGVRVISLPCSRCWRVYCDDGKWCVVESFEKYGDHFEHCCQGDAITHAALLNQAKQCTRRRR